MKDFNAWMSKAKPAVKCWIAIESLHKFQPRTNSQKTGVDLGGFSMGNVMAARPQGITLAEWQAFLSVACRSTRDYMATWAMSGFLASGIKVYCPTPIDCEAMVNVELRIPWDNYRQPFDSMAIIFPTEALEQFKDKPVACIIRHAPSLQLLSMSIPCESGIDLTSYIPYGGRANDEIETYVDGLYNHDGLDDEELLCIKLARRIAINSCMMLANYGTRPLGYANPDYAARLQEKLKNKKLPEHIHEANRQALAMIPQVYTIEQNIRLYDTEGGSHETVDPTGRHVRPHWRRGHWARVACGSRHSERRLVFRRPVMVRAEQFVGDKADTRVVYAR